MAYVWSVVLALSLLIGGCRPENPVVELKNYGKIEGLEVVRKSGAVFDTFRGIPYAKAPLGDLRFEKPEAPEPLSGTFDARNFGSPCWSSPELAELMQYPIPFSEDCLNLNVMKPKRPSADGVGYPVMVWIHGGGFTMGSSLEYGFEGILDQLVDKDVIFVAIHYRLNILGFFSLEEGTSRGNYGLWDQTLALKWVHDNIAAFGGDPKRVTVFGESAGGASVAIQTIATHSRDYVQGAIAMSGGPNAPWAVRPKSKLREPSAKLAELVGCKGDDVLDCMKKMPIEKLNAAVKENDYFKPVGIAAKFGPVMDGDYFEKSIEQLIDESPKTPIIAGVTELEAGLFVTPHFPMPLSIFGVDTSKPFTVEHFLSKSVKMLKTHHKYGEMDEGLLKSLVQYHYLDRHHRPLVEGCLLRLFSKLCSDITIVNDALDFALRKRLAGSKLYLYQFDYFNPEVFSADHKNKGAYHASELEYLFNTTIFYPHDFNHQDDVVLQKFTTSLHKLRQVRVSRVTLWNLRNPTPGALELTWRAVTDDKPLQYLSITPEPEMKASLDGNPLAFWLNFVPRLTGYSRKCPFADTPNKCPHSHGKQPSKGKGCPHAHKDKTEL